MNPKRKTRWWFCCISMLWLAGASFNGEASHIPGAEITYQYIGPSQYMVQVRLYRDCAGIFPPTAIDVCFSSDSCGFHSTASLTVTGSPFQLPPFPYLPPVVSSCNGGPGYGLERYVYAGMVTLPFACHDWQLSYSTPPSGGSWPPGSITPGFIVRTKIDNLYFPVNSSVSFIQDPPFLFCAGVTAIEYVTATDSDGDSITYQLYDTETDTMICPLQPTAPVPGSGYFFPVSSNTPFIHPTNGWISFIPSMIQVAFITAKVREYRNGAEVNETIISHAANVVGGCNLTGLGEPFSDASFIYISPEGDLAEIQIAGNAHIRVISSTGQMLMTTVAKNLQKTSLDLSRLTSGMYVIQTVCGNETLFRKFIRK